MPQLTKEPRISPIDISPNPNTTEKLNWSPWDRQELVVPSPKTGYRELPLFPELHDILLPLWEAASEGEPLLFPGHQLTNAALRSRLESACRAAGVPLWPKPFQNMRATRETELFNEYPVPTVVRWLGNSPMIALRHYAQTVKEHHARAVAPARPLHPSPVTTSNGTVNREVDCRG